MKETFREFSNSVSAAVGTSWAFIIAVLIIIIWGSSGPLFKFNDTWQLVINTGTTIITFLMVFLIQTTQNRDSRAIHLKLDELIKTNKTSRNSLLGIENVPDEDLTQFEKEFAALQKKYKKRKEKK